MKQVIARLRRCPVYWLLMVALTALGAYCVCTGSKTLGSLLLCWVGWRLVALNVGRLPDVEVSWPVVTNPAAR